MDLKKKLAATKTKLKEAAPTIAVIASAGAVIGVLITLTRNQEKKNATLADSNDSLESIVINGLQALIDDMESKNERLRNSIETEQKRLDDPQD